MSTDKKPQIDKFKEAARELDTDQSEERFDQLVRDIAKPSKPKDSGGKPKK